MSGPGGADAATWDQAMATLGVVPNPIGGTWPELTDKLLALYKDRVAQLAFVPSDWFDGVQALAKSAGAPVAITPYFVNGNLKPTSGANAMPAWIVGDPAAAQAWNEIAKLAHAAVASYTEGKIEEGRAELDKAYADVEFWTNLYNAVKNLPENIIGGVTGGGEWLVGGILKGLFKSWLFWLLALGVGGFYAWKFGLLAKLMKRKGS
jgi:hypothetical protein